MAKPRIRLTTPYDSPENLGFRCQKSRRNSNDITPNGGAKWRWGRFESGDLHHRTILSLRRSTAAILYSSAMTDGNDAFTVAEWYRPTAINNVRSKSITTVVYFNSRCASTVPSALAELLVKQVGSLSLAGAAIISYADVDDISLRRRLGGIDYNEKTLVTPTMRWKIYYLHPHTLHQEPGGYPRRFSAALQRRKSADKHR